MTAVYCLLSSSALPWHGLPLFLARHPHTRATVALSSPHGLTWWAPYEQGQGLIYEWHRLAAGPPTTQAVPLSLGEVLEHRAVPDLVYGCRSCGERGGEHRPHCSWVAAQELGRPTLPWVCVTCGRVHAIPAWWGPGAVPALFPCPCQRPDLAPLWGNPMTRWGLVYDCLRAVDPGRSEAELVDFAQRNRRVFGLSLEGQPPSPGLAELLRLPRISA